MADTGVTPVLVLTVHENDAEPHTVSLNDTTSVYLGRKKRLLNERRDKDPGSAVVCMSDRGVSGVHAHIVYGYKDSGGLAYWIRDLESSNGTYVQKDGRWIDVGVEGYYTNTVRLEEGAVILLGTSARVEVVELVVDTTAEERGVHIFDDTYEREVLVAQPSYYRCEVLPMSGFAPDVFYISEEGTYAVGSAPYSCVNTTTDGAGSTADEQKYCWRIRMSNEDADNPLRSMTCVMRTSVRIGDEGTISQPLFCVKSSFNRVKYLNYYKAPPAWESGNFTDVKEAKWGTRPGWKIVGDGDYFLVDGVCAIQVFEDSRRPLPIGRFDLYYVGDTRVYVKWRKLNCSYDVYYCRVGEEEWVLAHYGLEQKSFCCYIDGLEPGTEYSVYVQGRNDKGVGQACMGTFCTLAADSAGSCNDTAETTASLSSGC